MNIFQPRVMSYLLLCLITNVSLVLSRQYYIRDSASPSYMYHKFNQVDTDIFPEDIRIKVSLSQITGTLLYSIDENMNQLTVSLIDGVPPDLELNLNDQQLVVSLYRLCECIHCKYMILDLHIQINEYIQLQCNGETIRRITNEDRKHPLFYTIANTSQSEAHLWLVNTPYHRISHPINDQIRGCIFEVMYNDKPIIFSNQSRNIGQRCRTTCTDNICNGGRCHDGFEEGPICDCSKTFLNGRYCNDSIQLTNVSYLSLPFKFENLKVSWKSAVDKILDIKNGKVAIMLRRNSSKLFIEYSNVQNIISKVILLDRYVPNTEYVCIIELEINLISIMLYNHGSWINAEIQSSIDLRRQTFYPLDLNNAPGYIDVVHKDYHEYQWRSLSMRQPINEFPTKVFSETVIVHGLVIGFVIFLVAGSIYIIYVQGGPVCTNDGSDIPKLTFEDGIDKDGKTELHYECASGNIDTVKLLLDQGADIDCRDNDGRTGLHHACYCGHTEIVKLLLDQGADSDCRDNNGWSVVHFACEGGFTDTLKLLLERGFNIDFRDNIGRVGLHNACRTGKVDIVELILDIGFDINCRDNNGWTGLHHGCRIGNINVVKLLLDRGMKIDSRTNNGSTGLQYACITGQTDIVKLLLDRGMNIECTDNMLLTALHCASDNGHHETVKFLLERGANISCRDNRQKSPISMARQSERDACVRVFEDTIRVAISNGGCGGWTHKDYQYLFAIREFNTDKVASFSGDIIKTFRSVYKDQMMVNIQECSPQTEYLKIAINCLAVALQCDVSSIIDIQVLIVILLEELYSYVTNDITAKRIVEIILYNVCQYKLYDPVKDNNIFHKYWSNLDVSEEIKLSSSVIMCHMTSDVIDESNIDTITSYLSSVIYLHISRGCLGFCHKEILDSLSQINSVDNEGSEREYIKWCMGQIGWENNEFDLGLESWMEHINSKIPMNTLSGSQMEKMYNLMKGESDAEYWNDIIILFAYMRIFTVPSLINDENTGNVKTRSILCLISSLYDKYKYKRSDYNVQLLECMMDFVEEMPDFYRCDTNLQPLIESILSFIAYSAISYSGYERDLTFLESYLGEEGSVPIWSSVIMCMCTKECKYAEILREYLNIQFTHTDEMNRDTIVIYMALNQCTTKHDKFIDNGWTNVDYRLIMAVNQCDILTEDSIKYLNNTIIGIFIDQYKYEIIDKISSDSSMTESHKISINCVSESLHCRSIYDDNLMDTILLLLEELYPHTIHNITAMRIAEMILYIICDYTLYERQSYNNRMHGVCHKYWTYEKMSEEIILMSSVIMCYTTKNSDVHSDIEENVVRLSDIFLFMDVRKMNTYLGLPRQNIKDAVLKIMVLVNRLRNLTNITTNSLERLIKTMNKTTNTMGLIVFTVDNFRDRKLTNKDVYSPHFYSHKNGYKLRLRVHPNGHEIKTHLTLYFIIGKGEYDDRLSWPCDKSFTLSIINQQTGEAHRSKKFNPETRSNDRKDIDLKPKTENSFINGLTQFVSQSDLDSVDGLVVNDCLLFTCDSF